MAFQQGHSNRGIPENLGAPRTTHKLQSVSILIEVFSLPHEVGFSWSLLFTPRRRVTMASVDTFVTLLSANQHATYSYVSALTCLSYDIILTSDLEINYIWGSHWSIVKVLYFVVRYYAFISLIPMVACTSTCF
ncbi:hypothetical protein L208DRAFT_1388938 [Tricholoma matsutake]|nr:hypothetical protein L208DRAFT_1388938 [Tricholoma matsutake 945]